MPHHILEYFLVHLVYRLAGEHALQFAPFLILPVLLLVYGWIAYNMFRSNSNDAEQ